MDGPLKAAILVVSTTAAADLSKDASIPILKDVLERENPEKWQVVDTAIVSDIKLEIESQIIRWIEAIDPAPDLILTTGGTGFAVSDNTPEVRQAFHEITTAMVFHT